MTIKDAECLVLMLGTLSGCTGAPHPAILPDLVPSQPAIRDDYLLSIDAQRVRLTREYLTIHHPTLARSLPTADDAASIVMQPRVIVVHYTVLASLEEVMAYFEPNQIGGGRATIRNNGLLNVGVQFVVDRDGAIYRFYPEDVIARHTIGLNHVAIGIENVADGDLEHPSADHPLTTAQLESNVALVRYLATRFPSIEFLIGHQEYRQLEEPSHPGHELFVEQLPTYRTEKVDPGPTFMKRLRMRLVRGL